MASIIEFMHEAVAYNQAALQLMVGEANFVSTNLGYPPIRQTNELVNVSIYPAPMGVGGSFQTTNLTFGFERGRLHNVQVRSVQEWFRMAATNSSLVPEVLVADGTPLARSLSERWAMIVGVDLAAISATNHFMVRTSFVMRPDQPERPDRASRTIPELSKPLAVTTRWTRNPESFNFTVDPIHLSYRAHDQALIRAVVYRDAPRTRPKLGVTNWHELIAPVPTEKAWLTKFLGGQAARDTVDKPDRVTARMLHRLGKEEGSDPVENPEPVPVPRSLGREASLLLLDFDSYAWGSMKMCGGPVYVASLTFVRATNELTMDFCFNCNDLQVTFNKESRKDAFDCSQSRFLGLFRQIFPRDPLLRSVKPDDDAANFTQYRRSMESLADPELR